MFILRQKLLLAVVGIAVLGWAGLLLQMTYRNGKLNGETAVMLVAISLLCGGGTAALTVLPGFMVYRWLFTRPPEPELLPGETLLHSVAANHFLDGEGRGGRLHLTGQRLVFCPHRFNVQLDLWSAGWEEVTAASIPDSHLVTAASMALGASERGLQNFLHLQLRDGTTARLVVKGREEVVRLIERVRRLPPAERAAALQAA